MATNRVQLQLHPFCNGSRKVRHKIGLAPAVLNRAVEGRIHSLPIKSGGKFELLKACVFKEWIYELTAAFCEIATVPRNRVHLSMDVNEPFMSIISPN